MMDAQDRVWFGEYRGNKIGMFDTKTETFKEWTMPTPWSEPYDVVVDKNGEAWTGSMINDRIDRLDPKTGQVVEYLLPHETNIRRVFVDNSTTPGDVLGRQQPPRLDRQARAARLTLCGGLCCRQTHRPTSVRWLERLREAHLLTPPMKLSRWASRHRGRQRPDGPPPTLRRRP